MFVNFHFRRNSGSLGMHKIFINYVVSCSNNKKHLLNAQFVFIFQVQTEENWHIFVHAVVNQITSELIVLESASLVLFMDLVKREF